jgi:hypothetical protein
MRRFALVGFALVCGVAVGHAVGARSAAKGRTSASTIVVTPPLQPPRTLRVYRVGSEDIASSETVTPRNAWIVAIDGTRYFAHE